MDPYEWSLNPEAITVVLALTIAYWWALRRFPAPPWRIACFAGAMLLVLGVTITPIDTIALHYLLSIHLVQNVVLAEWAPLLFVLSIPPALAALAPRVPPLAALALWVVNYGVWHMPWLYDTALRHPHPPAPGARSLLRDGRPALVAGRPLAAVVGRQGRYVFAAFALASPIGLVMALVPEPLYDFYVQGPGLWGLDRWPTSRSPA